MVLIALNIFFAESKKHHLFSHDTKKNGICQFYFSIQKKYYFIGSIILITYKPRQTFALACCIIYIIERGIT